MKVPILLTLDRNWVFFARNKEERHSQPQTQQVENYVPEKKVAPIPQVAMVFHNAIYWIEGERILKGTGQGSVYEENCIAF